MKSQRKEKGYAKSLEDYLGINYKLPMKMLRFFCGRASKESFAREVRVGLSPYARENERTENQDHRVCDFPHHQKVTG